MRTVILLLLTACGPNIGGTIKLGDDKDGDGFVAAEDGGDDCDDRNSAVYPGADEICDGIDNDCDGQIDDGVTLTVYVDADSDGWGSGDAIQACAVEHGHSETPGDCDDTDPSVNPDAIEVCDDIDNDCDSGNDLIQSDWYLDADGDGWGDPDMSVIACEAPDSSYVAQSGDCDDEDPARFPGNPEVCDGLDNDCDDVVPADEQDSDGDGFAECEGDCNDGNAGIHPDAVEICNDGVDENCNGNADEGTGTSWYLDADGDGFGDAGDMVVDCATSYPGRVTNPDDCDDSDAARFPGNPEVCDGLDNDCDSALPADEQDADGDGVMECAGDCDDSDASRFPGNPEVCDRIDNDCDDVVPADEEDTDGDGFAECEGDCDDADATVNPAASETCDGRDEDCDGVADNGLPTNTYYPDSDGDGAGDGSAPVDACAAPVGYVTDATDCDDTDSSLNQDDADADGASTCDGDCDDADASLSLVDADGDGYSTCDGDCDDSSALAYPGRGRELDLGEDGNCTDGLDNDCDGNADAADWDCGDADGDGIYNGVDAMFLSDTDGDGNDDAFCVFAEEAFAEPWSQDDLIAQGTVFGGYYALNTAYTVSLQDEDGDGTPDSACKTYLGQSTGSSTAQFVSAFSAVDGTTAVDTTDDCDWVSTDLNSFCSTYSDALCRNINSTYQCGVPLGSVFDLNWNATTSTLSP